MKKLLGIVVLGLLFSSNVYAEKIIKVCKDLRNPPILDSFTFTVDKSAGKVSGKMTYNDTFIRENNLAGIKTWTREYFIFSTDSQSISFYYTNYERWRDNYKWVNKTGNVAGQKYWNVYDQKSLKKLRKKEGPENFRKYEAKLNLKLEGQPLYQKIHTWKKKGYETQEISIQFICYSQSAFAKKNEQDKKEKIIQASDKMKKEIEPFKNMCKNIGYSAGTEKFADCVKDLYLKNLDAKNQSQTQSQTTITSVPKKKIDPSVWDDLLNISKGMSEGKSFTESLGGVGSSSSSSSSKIQCFKSGERISGTNKICSYNCMGSEVVQNISSTSICALSIDLN